MAICECPERATSRIAVVDDDAGVRKALTRLLKAANFDVEAFAGATEFISSLASGTPDCAVIDLQMPSVTGLELQNFLARAKVQCPTIVITAHDEPGSEERCIAAGATAYLRKPVRRAALLDAIESALGRRS